MGDNFRPEICAPVQLVPPGAEGTTGSIYKLLKRVMNHLQQTPDVVLTFFPINLDKIRLVMFTDASFANARELKSQLGFILLIVDD